MLDSQSERRDRQVEQRATSPAVRPFHSNAPPTWHGALVQSYRNPPGEAALPPPAAALLVVHLDGTAWLERTLTGQYTRRRSVPGDVSLIPAGAESSWRWDTERTSVHIQLTPTFLAQIAQQAGDRDGAASALADCFAIVDPLIHQLAVALYTELHSPSSLGQLYTDSLIHTLGIHLLRTYHTSPIPIKPASGQFTPQIRQRVLECIEANLTGDLSIAELAACANLSSYHFSRLFRNSFGRSPHQYLIERRIDRARQLVLFSDLPLSQVARLVGIGDQSQLTRHFTRLLGVPPGRLRNERTNRRTEGTNPQDTRE